MNLMISLRKLRTRIALRSARNSLFTPSARYGQVAVDRVIVLTPGDIPSTDIYFTTRFAQGSLPWKRIDTRRIGSKDILQAELSTPGAFLIIVRYLDSDCLDLIARAKEALSGVAYFMDDDLPGALDDPWLPRGYAEKLVCCYNAMAGKLAEICDRIWLSSPSLQARYPHVATTCLDPLYIDRTLPTHNWVTIFYHGTASHTREIEWLADVAKEVQSRHDNTIFEVMGNAQVRSLFSGIPRMRVLHVMPWSDYLAHTSAVSYDIGLAPCFDSPFNNTRTHNKLFDITRCGAAGIYSLRPPFSELITHEREGLLVDDNPADWFDAIAKLIANPLMRKSVVSHATCLCQLKTGKNSNLEWLKHSTEGNHHV